MEYIELSAAKAWGMAPDQWRARTEDDRARMMAQVQYEAAYQAWAQDQITEQARKDGGRGASAGGDERPEHPMFAAMKRRLSVQS